jgi:hypothetical protein
VRRVAASAAVLLAALGLWSLVRPAPLGAQVPPLPTPTPLPVPSESPSPSPEPSPEQSPTPSPEESPPPPPPEESPVASPEAFPPFEPSIPTFGPPERAAPAPQPAPAPVTARPALSLDRSLPAAYAFGTAGVLAAGVVLPAGIAFARPRRAPRSRRIAAVHARLSAFDSSASEEVTMPRQGRRWRLIAGATLIAAAVAVAIAGYMKISLEPIIGRQVPYLASAGLATLILVVTGGSFLMADQIRAEDERVDEIERSLERLAEMVGPSLEAPPRVAAGRRARASAES